MKAKDYYDKYEHRFMTQNCLLPPEEFSLVACDFINEMFQEFQEVLKTRGIKRLESMTSAAKEFNQKYNAIVSLFEKCWGVSPLSRNGFKEVILREFPFLRTFWK